MTNPLLLSSLLFMAIATGCKPPGPKPATQLVDAAVQRDDSTKAETKDAALLRLENLSFEQKAVFIAATKKELNSLNRDLDELNLMIQKASVKVRAGARPGLSIQRGRAAQLSKLLDEADNANVYTWTDIKIDSTTTFIALKAGVGESRKWINDNIAN